MRRLVSSMASAASVKAIALSQPRRRHPDCDNGKTLFRDGDLDGAVCAFRRALREDPDNVEAHDGLGAIALIREEVNEAIAHYRHVLRRRPEFARAHYNLGSCLYCGGDLDAALVSFERAVTLKPGFTLANIGRASVYLVRGDWERGWALYESRLGPGEANERRWRGEPLEGRRILLRCEQGLGDILQFVRYARLVSEMGGRVILQPPARLAPARE